METFYERSFWMHCCIEIPGSYYTGGSFLDATRAGTRLAKLNSCLQLRTRKLYRLLNNFSAFKPRVIFVDVIKNTAIDSLQNSFTEYLLLQNKFPLNKDHKPFHPHVTIATRDLYKKAFYEAWEIFSREEFKAEWKIDSISLLRHNKKNWDVICTSQFPKK